MPDNDENSEVTALEDADGKDVQAEEDAPLIVALRQLLSALDFHRLVFLYYAGAVRANPQHVAEYPWDNGLETLSFPFSKITAAELAVEGDEYIRNLQDKLELHAQKALGQFGNGAGERPKMRVEGQWIEVEGGSQPFWTIEAHAVLDLKRTSDEILAACAQIAAADVRGEFNSLIDQAIGAARDKGQSTWSAGRRIRWEYLEELNSAVCAVKDAEIRAHFVKGRRHQKAKKSQERRFKPWPGSGDACFVIDGVRVKFHHKDKCQDLRLKIGSQAHTILLFLLEQEQVPSKSISRLLKTRTKAYHVVRQVNILLNRKIRQVGFSTLPEYEVEFIDCRKQWAYYVACIPVISQQDFNRKQIQDATG